MQLIDYLNVKKEQTQGTKRGKQLDTNTTNHRLTRTYNIPHRYLVAHKHLRSMTSMMAMMS